jgi:hypothetical protein
MVSKTLLAAKQFLLYKVDGNSLGLKHSCYRYVAPTPLMLQEVEDDGVSFIGDPVPLLENTRYNGPGIEAPAMTYEDGKYYLIYNSRCYANETYSVHYATSFAGIEGPYRRSPRPLLITGQKVEGVELLAPGGVDIDPSNASRIVFHSDVRPEWFDRQTYQYFGRNRALFGAGLVFGDGGMLSLDGIS